MIILAAALILLFAIAANFSLIRTLFCNLTAPKLSLDDSADWAGGRSEHLVYGDSDSQYIDLYIPSDAENPPLFVLVHGGGFILNDAHSHQAQFMYRYFRDNGYACATVNYRLASEAPFPAACEDVHNAVVFLSDHAEQYGYQADRIAIWGESAGAYLAAREALTERDASIKALVGYYGIYDFSTAEEQFTAQGIPKFIRSIANSWISGQSEEYDSPEEYWVRKASSDWTDKDIADYSVLNIAEQPASGSDLQIWLLHGLTDITVPHMQSVNLAEALRQSCGEENVRLDLLDGYIHGDDRFYTDGMLHEVDLFLREAFTD